MTTSVRKVQLGTVHSSKLPSLLVFIRERTFGQHRRAWRWQLGAARPHCGYLDIYISQKIRLCKGDFESKFQTSVQASIMNFLVRKFKFLQLIFLLFLAGVVKSTAFCTQLLLFQKD